jgi:hypothetical protein
VAAHATSVQAGADAREPAGHGGGRAAAHPNGEGARRGSRLEEARGGAYGEGVRRELTVFDLFGGAASLVAAAATFVFAFLSLFEGRAPVAGIFAAGGLCLAAWAMLRLTGDAPDA